MNDTTVNLNDLVMNGDAYLNKLCNQSAAYYQIATSVDGNSFYEIKYTIINNNCEDESDACDWQNPESITLVDHKYYKYYK